MTYKVATCIIISKALALSLIKKGKDGFSQYHDNVTEWDIVSYVPVACSSSVAAR